MKIVLTHNLNVVDIISDVNNITNKGRDIQWDDGELKNVNETIDFYIFQNEIQINVGDTLGEDVLSLAEKIGNTEPKPSNPNIYEQIAELNSKVDTLNEKISNFLEFQK